MFRKTKVIIGQLGSPKAPTAKAVRPYLREFLGDPRVVDLPRVLWWFILNLFVLPFRPKKSAEAYARIYNEKDGTFPLITNTEDFAHELEKHLDENIELNYAFLLSYPKVEDVFGKWVVEDKLTRADEVFVIPQFPQYSESTTASVVDKLGSVFGSAVNIPSFHFISNHHRLKVFIDLSAKKVQQTLDAKKPDHLIISFHGIPLRRVLQKKDDYYQHCYETYALIKEQLNLENTEIHICFQSRFGSEQWLGPATDEYAVGLAEKKEGTTIACYCPSFVVDCLETTDEIGNELREELEEHNSHLHFIECLNSDQDWAQGYAHYINTLVNGSKNDLRELFYHPDEKKMVEEMPEQKQKSTPMSDHGKKNVKLMFLTLFLDLVGFSIIFPLFPTIAGFYLGNDSSSPLLSWMLNISNFVPGQMNSIVLFGSILGAIYSFLQFFASPIWGNLSDKFGRRPMLLLSTFGMMISYVLWFFSGSFLLFFIARVVGGIMGGNLSVASAVIADVTDEKNRSKGMAFIGVAFALGFIVGPALGGIFSTVHLSIASNPFATPALVAFVLCSINFFFILTKYKETYTPDSGRIKRSFNIFKSIGSIDNKNIRNVNYVNFLFTTAFSGMEFTLTFLAVERLGYSSMDNAYMFVFIGLVLALVQGGYVRRKSNIIGEGKMVLRGIPIVALGLIILSQAYNGYILYLGLFFLATGSSMIIPNLTSLVSLFSEKSEQGKRLGSFRSLGALGRVFGPILAGTLYWTYGAMNAYIICAIFLILPTIMIKRVPRPKSL